MHQAGFVGVVQTQRRLTHVLARFGHGQRPLLRDQSVEADAIDALHDQEVNVAGPLGVVDGDDVGVMQPGGGLDLAVETLDGRGVGGVPPIDDLEGDRRSMNTCSA